MGPFPYPRTWPRLVHVTILLALALALGIGYPDAEAKKPASGDNAQKRGDRPAASHGDQGKKPKGRAGNKPNGGGSGEEAAGGGDDKPKDPSGETPDPGEPQNEPNKPGSGESPTKPDKPSQPIEPSQPNTPNRPTTPSIPSVPVTTTPPPAAQTPAAPLVIGGTDEGRSSTGRRGARRGLENGATLRLTARLLRPPSALAFTTPIRPFDGIEAPSGEGDADGSGGTSGGSDESSVSRTVREIVEVVPNSLKLILTGLAALSILLGGASLFTQLRARRLDAQRRELLQEVGLLQGALLPPVPEELGSAFTSVAYRPAHGPGAGGDFYDAIPLPGGRAAFILGDVSGHGRDALERTAFLRYTLRAYLEAGLEPRIVLQVAGRVIDEQLGGDFATVLIAIYDPHSGSLTYASAGHPAPIVAGPSTYEPVLAASSPPIGVGVATGLRQTTLPLAPGSVACLYTDGLTEARTERGLVGRGRLTDLVEELGRNGTAEELLERVAGEARILSDDMAACLITPGVGVTVGGFRTEQLELSAEDVTSGLAQRFLDACGVSSAQAEQGLAEARDLTKLYGGTVLRVVFGNRITVEVLPRNVQSIEAASRQAAAAV